MKSDDWLKKNPNNEENLKDILAFLALVKSQGQLSEEEYFKKWTELSKECLGSFYQFCLQEWTIATHSFLKKNKLEDYWKDFEKTFTIVERKAWGVDNQKKFVALMRKNTFIAEKISWLPESVTIDQPKPWHLVKEQDPLLETTAKTYCRNNANITSKIWTNWSKSLPAAAQIYWNAKSFNTCKPFSYKDQETKTQDAIDKLYAIKKENTHFTIGLFYDLVKVYRSTGDRRKSAQAYLGLIDAWKKNKSRAAEFLLKSEELELRKIEDALWASRALILIENYDEAKKIALEVIEKAKVLTIKFKGKNQQYAANLVAESFHVIASRIYVDAKDFANAYDFTSKALEQKLISSEWKDRLQWQNALYLYIMQKKDKALEVLLELDSRLNNDNTIKSTVLYWIARTMFETKSARFEEYLNKLWTQFPWSFYSNNAIDFIGSEALQAKTPMRKFAKEFEAHAKNYVQSQSISAVLTSDPTLKKIVARLWFSYDLGFGKWQDSFLKEARSHINKKYRPLKNAEVFVFLSRLEAKLGQFSSAFSTTSMLGGVLVDFWQKFPEQFFVIFPSPYKEIMDNTATKLNLDKTWLIGIAKQESALNPEAVSPVGAVGLIQVMPATAGIISPEQVKDFDHSSIREKLKDPAFNLEIGAQLLKQLNKRYQNEDYQVFAAYNAGEFVVDRWIQKRSIIDKLVWLELIPFQETRNYVRNVSRNVFAYKLTMDYDNPAD